MILPACRQIFLLFFFILFLLSDVRAEEYRVLRSKQAKVLYPAELAETAKEIVRILPGIRGDLFDTFRWHLESRPTIVLVADPVAFQRMAGNARVAAFAVPDRNLVVMNHARVSRRPFSLRATLTHEICHLLLHARIERDRFPRWLDEGLCQWASGGVDELMLSPKHRLLNRAALSGRLLTLSQLETSFPGSHRDFQLAYEQSRHFVLWLVKTHGKEAVLAFLERLAGGGTPAGSIHRATGVSLATLESRWKESFERPAAWLVFFSRHVYEWLFVAAALATVTGYIRYRIRKRNYVDVEDEV